MPPKGSKASEESKPETIDLVIEHELHGVTPEMIDWWWTHIDNSERYKLWHPEDHISFEWEVPLGENGLIGAIHTGEERIAELPARKIRIGFVDPTSPSFPIPIIYPHIVAACGLGPNNEHLGR